MIKHALLLVLASLLVLLACTPDPEVSPDQIHPPLADSLAAVRAYYEALRLPEALVGARRLRIQLEAPGAEAEVLDAVRAELYQYLAMLHHQRGLFPDSVALYTEWARSSLTERSSDQALARQQLCTAYSNYENWAWLEQQLNARLGRRINEAAGSEATLLNAWLILAEAVGRKQYADDLDDEAEKERWKKESLRSVREAIILLKSLDSPWIAYARHYQGLLLVGPPEEDGRFLAYIDSLRNRNAQGYTAGSAQSDELMGYWHWHRNRLDSAAIYYRKLISEDDLFSYHSLAEAYYLLGMEASRRGNYASALEYVHKDMLAAKCCPQHTSNPLECTEQPFCTFFLNYFADEYLLRYLKESDVADRKAASEYVIGALKGYETTFTPGQTEGVLNRNLDIGDRLINSSLRTMSAIVADHPTESSINDMFRTMEVGKSYLLVRQLQERADSFSVYNAGQTGPRLRQAESDIGLLKVRFARSGHLTEDQLWDFQRLTKLRDKLRSHFWDQQGVLVNGLLRHQEAPSLPGVRDRLARGTALIEYAETATELYALYVDCDTALVEQLPRDRVKLLSDSLVAMLIKGDSPDIRAYAAVAGELYHHLLGFAPQGGAKRDHLLVVPSMSLVALPFSALVTEQIDPPTSYEGLHYLLDDQSVRYLESWGAELQFAARRDRSKTRNPKIGVWTHPDLDGYLGKLGEVLVDDAATGSRHYRFQDCSTQSLLEEADRFDWLQVSVHAGGNPDQLNDNYLYLAPSDSINALVIGNQPLRAELVVLAACSTARGFSDRREGTFSIRRNYHLAGVPDVIASLYDIPAAATADLLAEFYRGVFSGLTAPEALHAAQRKARSGGLHKRYIHPKYWAGLILG